MVPNLAGTIRVPLCPTGDVQMSRRPTHRTASFQKIELHTRLGNRIENSQQDHLTLWDLSQYADLERRYPNAIPRTRPNPVYNCHGMVFGSRRTGIDETRALLLILDDDCYQEVEVDSVLPGDVILYYDPDGEIEHSGIVVDWDRQTKQPRVVSKWGRYKEVVHYGSQCPYNFLGARYYRVMR